MEERHNMGHFDSFFEFVQMGSHGVFVWSVYGITIAVIVGHWVALRQQKQRVLRELRKMKKRGNV